MAWFFYRRKETHTQPILAWFGMVMAQLWQALERLARPTSYPQTSEGLAP
jgi:hypothetical protein